MDSRDESLNPFADPSVVNAQYNEQNTQFQDNNTFQYNTPQNIQSEPFNTGSAPWTQQTATSVPINNNQNTFQSQKINSNINQNVNLNSGTSQQTNGVKNWPPIPSFIPYLKPCFTVDIEKEIPIQHQQFVKLQLYSCYEYIATLLLNMLLVFIYLFIGYDFKISQFCIGIILSAFFIVTTLLGHFITLYRAIKSDSQSGYLLYLVYSVFKIIVLITQIVGAIGSGWSGFALVSKTFEDKENPQTFYGVLCLICSLGFLYYFAFTIYYCYKVRFMYYLAKHRELTNIIQATQGMSKMVNHIP